MANFTFLPNGNLKISIDDDDRVCIDEMIAIFHSEYDIFYAVTEHVLCNSEWEVVPSGMIALFDDSRIALSREIERDESGEILRIGAIYTFNDYQLRSEVDDMINKGHVILTRYE